MKNLIRQICLTVAFALVLFASTCFAAIAPMPMAVGASEGEWTYLGRFVSQRDFPSILEWETRLKPYTSSAEVNGLYDVYFHHEHYGNGEGQGCYSYKLANMKSPSNSEYSCILKIVPLDKKGVRINKPGGKFGTRLLSMFGGAKGVFQVRIDRMRIFDAVSHQMIGNTTNYSVLNGNFRDYDSSVMMIRSNSPFFKARAMSNCPVRPYDMRHG